MKVYQEKIAPPPALPTDEERTTLKMESKAHEDRWVKNLIESLAGIIRDDKGLK